MSKKIPEYVKAAMCADCGNKFLSRLKGDGTLLHKPPMCDRCWNHVPSASRGSHSEARRIANIKMMGPGGDEDAIGGWGGIVKAYEDG